MAVRIIPYWQNANERWAERRCGELGIPYSPLWSPTPHAALPKTADPAEREEVILQWARMNPFEHELWGEKYPEIRAIPAEMLAQEKERQRRMWVTERKKRSGLLPPPAEPEKGKRRAS